MESEALFRGRKVEPPFKFPFNCIGWILLQAKDNPQKSAALETGFLISENLVLTSTNGFFIQQEGSLQSLTPSSFSLFQLDNIKRQYKIEKFRVNPMYISLQRQFKQTVRVMEQSKDETKINKLREKAMKIKIQQIGHDFALLKLQQNVVRPKYMQLEPNLNAKVNLTVSGYYNDILEHYYQVTHSNQLVQIADQALYYDIDTKSGQGGSPVYMESKDCRVVGIHKGFNFIKKLRFATMITTQLIKRVKTWSTEMTVVMHDEQSQIYSDDDDQINENENVLKGKDRREQVIFPEINNFPHNCIGWLIGKNSSNSTVIGTGFLISSSFVLTSAHTIREIISNDLFGSQIPLTFSTEKEKGIKIKNFRANKQYLDYANEILSLLSIRELTDNPEQRRIIRDDIKNIHRKERKHDFALLQLSEQIQRPKYFQLFPTYNQLLQPTLVVAGYINCFGERFDHLTHSGKVGPVSEGVIYYDVDTSKGQSGAPVFIKNNNKLVGIHKGYSPEDKLNFGTLITKEMIEILRAWGLEMITLFTVVS